MASKQLGQMIETCDIYSGGPQASGSQAQRRRRSCMRVRIRITLHNNNSYLQRQADEPFHARAQRHGHFFLINSK
ncbi:unnamed protein product, partial [Brenthis ino]